LATFLTLANTKPLFVDLSIPFGHSWGTGSSLPSAIGISIENVTLTELFFHDFWYGCPCILAAPVTSIPLAAHFQLPRSSVNNIDCFTAGTICVTHSDAGILTRHVNVRFGREELYAGFVGPIGIPECRTSWYC
jgi:hypothetical protein